MSFRPTGKLGVIGIFILVFLAITTYFFSQDQINGIDLSQEQLNGIKLYQKLDSVDFKQQFGDPGSYLESLKTKQLTYYMLKKGLEVAVDIEKRVTKVIIDSTNLESQTSRKIMIGMSTDDVKKKYGENFTKRSEQGASILFYRDREINTVLEFWCNNDRVDRIVLAATP